VEQVSRVLRLLEALCDHVKHGSAARGFAAPRYDPDR
jgi:hypothetical protein